MRPIAKHYQRYVALGDSSSEGLEDPDGQGRYRGWTNRLAEHIAAAQDEPLHYANLAIRGRRTRVIRESQLERACAMRPDLATVFSGTNDVIARRFDLAAVIADIELMQGTLRAGGATVLTLTLPDLSPVMPLARLVRSRILALNQGLRAVAERHGVLLVDLAAYPVASDPRLWSDDRLHANADGHARIAAALAAALGIPGIGGDWSRPLPRRPTPTWPQRVAAEVGWARRFLLPWAGRHVLGRSSGDGLEPKRPTLRPVHLPADRPDPAHS